MSEETQPKLPSQHEIEKEISKFLASRYGDRVKIIGLQAQTETAGIAGAERKQPPPADFSFDIKPQELADYLDEYVIRQDEAKAILATKICTHFNRVRHGIEHPEAARRTEGRIKNNVLLIGPTGVGKTYLIKLIARRLGVPFIKGDATKFSETGYVGGDVEDLVRDLAREADNDLERAQYGIIYIDEIDKIASAPNRIGADVSRTGVQRALLKPMEETEVDLRVPHDPISQIEAIEHYRATGKRQRQVLNTRNILFIMSGAFNSLADIVKQRVQRQSMGFESEVATKRESSRFLKDVKAEDLIQFGFESEFIGRLPVLACLEELSRDDLYLILLNANNAVVVGKKLDFRSYAIHIQFEEEALREIARLAFLEGTGARGLVSVMERTLLPFEKHLPSTDIRFLVVTPAMVRDPRRELARLLEQTSPQDYFQERFQQLNQLERERLAAAILRGKGDYLRNHELIPTRTRLEMMAGQCQEEIMETGDVCDLFIELIHHVHGCEKEMSAKCGLGVTFSEEAIDRLLDLKPRRPETINQVCKKLTAIFEYGLELLEHKKGVDHVVIPAKGVDEPEEYINNLVKESFRL